MDHAANHLLIFVGVFLTDVVYTLYLQAIYQQRILASCCWASVVTIISGVIIINYTASAWAVAAAATGAFVGTYISMRYIKPRMVQETTYNSCK